jgi:hypothetical protein
MHKDLVVNAEVIECRVRGPCKLLDEEGGLAGLPEILRIIVHADSFKERV